MARAMAGTQEHHEPRSAGGLVAGLVNGFDGRLGERLVDGLAGAFMAVLSGIVTQ